MISPYHMVHIRLVLDNTILSKSSIGVMFHIIIPSSCQAKKNILICQKRVAKPKLLTLPKSISRSHFTCVTPSERVQILISDTSNRSSDEQQRQAIFASVEPTQQLTSSGECKSEKNLGSMRVSFLFSIKNKQQCDPGVHAGRGENPPW
jgi:hypothetical protein